MLEKLENTVLISIKSAAKTELRQNEKEKKKCGFCAFGAKYKNKISHDLNTVEWCYFSMMLEIDWIFSQNEKNWYSDNFQEPSKGAQYQITTQIM